MPGLLPRHVDRVERTPSRDPGTHGGARVGRSQGRLGRPCTGRANTSLYVRKVRQLYGGLSGPSHPKVERLTIDCTATTWSHATAIIKPLSRAWCQERVNQKGSCTCSALLCRSETAVLSISIHEIMKVLFVDNLITRNLSCRRFD